MSTDFGRQNSLKQKSPGFAGSADNIPVSAINLAMLAELVGKTRDVVDKIIAKFIYVLGRSIREGRTILLSIHRVAELSIGKCELSCEFNSEFLTLIREGGSGHSNIPGKASTMRTVERATRPMSADVTKRRNSMNNRVDPFADNIYGDSDERGSHQRQRPPLSRETPTRHGNNIPNHTWNNVPNNSKYGGRGGDGSSGGVGYERSSSSQSYRTNSSRSSSLMVPSPRSQENLHSYRSNIPSTAREGQLRKENLEKLQQQQIQQNGKSSTIYHKTRPQSAEQPFNRYNMRSGDGVTEAMGNPRAAVAKALGTEKIIEKVKQKIVERGGSNGIASVGRLLKIMDNDGNKTLSRNELK